MHVFQPVDPADIDEGPFKFTGLKVLVTAGSGDKVNTAAASFGAVGYLWNRRVVYIFLREKRFTRELVEQNGAFSLSFLNHDEFRGAIKYIDAVSGRGGVAAAVVASAAGLSCAQPGGDCAHRAGLALAAAGGQPGFLPSDGRTYSSLPLLPPPH